MRIRNTGETSRFRRQRRVELIVSAEIWRTTVSFQQHTEYSEKTRNYAFSANKRSETKRFRKKR
jgi:hypothetical protein